MCIQNELNAKNIDSFKWLWYVMCPALYYPSITTCWGACVLASASKTTFRSHRAITQLFSSLICSFRATLQWAFIEKTTNMYIMSKRLLLSQLSRFCFNSTKFYLSKIKWRLNKNFNCCICMPPHNLKAAPYACWLSMRHVHSGQVLPSIGIERLRSPQQLYPIT